MPTDVKVFLHFLSCFCLSAFAGCITYDATNGDEVYATGWIFGSIGIYLVVLLLINYINDNYGDIGG